MIKELSSAKVYDTGYVFIVSNNGTFVSHPNPLVVVYSNLTKFDVGAVDKALKDGSNPTLVRLQTDSDRLSLQQLADEYGAGARQVFACDCL